MSTDVTDSDYSQSIDRLVDLSMSTYYNPYKTFKWPDSLPDQQWWMSQDLLTVYGTSQMQQLGEPQLMALSKWESINFYSLNIHGIRELLLEVTKRIHSPGYQTPSKFFHHFIGEENEHMWFFAEFCLRYASKIYPDRNVKLNSEPYEPDVESLLVFIRILVFEEIVDYFNTRMAKDGSLVPIIQQINAIHHQDESRHIAFGRQIVKQLYAQVSAKHPAEKLRAIETYVKGYIVASIQSLYNPAVYRDALIPEPHNFRRLLLQDPARRPHHKQFLKRTTDFLFKTGIISQEDFL
jgi:P-aminobenzoate N-oxygenase AurF